MSQNYTYCCFLFLFFCSCFVFVDIGRTYSESKVYIYSVLVLQATSVSGLQEMGQPNCCVPQMQMNLDHQHPFFSLKLDKGNTT